MQTLNRFFITLGVSLLFGGSVITASAIDISSTIWLDRYTILDDGVTVQHDSGHLIGNGSFQVITSEIMDPFEANLVGINTFAPISGRTIMDETMFDAYKAQKVI